MLLRLLLRPVRPGDATRVFYLFSGISTFCFTLSFTVNMIYMVTVVGLSPLQMVLVGTVLEISAFVFEIPTGIVADLYSRRVSVIIGFWLIGIGFLVQAVPSFTAILIAQVVWGIGSTFTSGAAQAWITDEIGEAAIPRVFTREQQIHLLSGVAGTVAAGLLSLAFLRLPMLVSGAGFLVLALWVWFVMPEEHFSPTPVQRRETFRHLARTAREGLRLAHARPVVRGLLLISLFVGLASEAFDRLWLVRIVEDFPLPPLLGAANVGPWFAGIALVGSIVALLASLLVNRFGAVGLGTRHPGRVLAVLTLVQVLCVLGVALSGWLWLALAALWLKGAALAIAAPVEAAWLNRELRSDIRATVLSMNAQVNAVGQVVGGPPLGALAGRTTVSTALVVSAGLLSPAVAIFGWLGRRRAPGPENGSSDPPTR